MPTETPPFQWPASMPRDAIPVVITVLRDRAGVRLDRFLTVEMPRLSRTRASRIAHDYAFTAAGRRLSPAKIVHAGDVIVLFRPAWEEPAVPRDATILYEDAALIAIDKPAGLPVHPTARFHRNTLTAVLAERYPGQRVALCHRLDKETSGVLLAACTVEAETTLKRAFADRAIHKVYRAIVHGRVAVDEFTVDAPLALANGEVSVCMEVRAVGTGGMASLTRVRVIERLDGFTVVEAEPETGRQHQIRVHLAHAGHAIVGDKLYAHGVQMFLDALSASLSDESRRTLLLERHALHAQRITFEHPTRRELMTIEAPWPGDCESFVTAHRTGTSHVDANRPGC